MLSVQLRAETRHHHQALEESLNLLRPGLTLDGYRQILATFYGYYRPLEERVLPALSAAFPGLMDGRRKADWIAGDLRALEVDAARIPLCEDLPAIDGVAAALGAGYVLEGSTLGGHMMSRHFQQSLGVTPGNGGAFFASYGARIPDMWRAYLSALDGWTGDGRDVAVRAASDTFSKLDRWARLRRAA